MRIITATGLALGVALLTGSDASAHGAKNQCIRDARAEAKMCIDLCKDAFQEKKASCLDISRSCLEAARDERQACVSEVLTALTQCVQTECGSLREAIADCRAELPPDSAELDQCIDAAQIAHFQCRDQCRETVELRASLRKCRAEFRDAIRLCPPPDEDDDDDEHDD